MNAVMNKLRNARLGSTFILLILVAIWSAPTIGLLITALRDRDEAAASGWWTAVADPFNQIWSMASFEKAIEGGMLTSLLNTLVISVPATILPLVIAANAAYAFTFIEFKGREVLFASLVALMVLPLQSALIPVLKAMVWLKKTFGIELVGNFASAWVVHAAFALPLAIYILRNFMMNRIGCTTVNIKGYTKLLERVFDLFIVIINDLLWSFTLFSGLNGNRHPVFICTRHKNHILLLKAQVANIDICWQVTTC